MRVIFLKFVNMSITASWIVLAVLLLRFLLRKAPKWIHCVLWGIVALRLIIPFSRESIFSLIPSAEVIPQDIAASPAIQTGIPAVNGAVNPILTARIPQGSPSLDSLLHILSVIWVLGAALMLLYSVFSYIRLRLQVRASLPVRKNVYESDDVDAPFILGILRPNIYIPSGMPQEQVQYVLSHERAHIKRLDHWWKPLGFVLLSLHWFNPLLWLTYILLCRDIEHACDERVISKMSIEDKRCYSETLVACSVHRRMVMACPVAFGAVSVKSRIKGILHYKKPAFWIILVGAAICVIACVCFLTNPIHCSHDYQSRITREAICTREGLETFTCTQCRHCYTQPIALAPHTYPEGIVRTAPTCLEEGSMEYACIDCGYQKTEAIALAPHTAGEPFLTQEPNCTEKGSTSATCTLCREVFVTQILETNQVHDLEETVITAATCTAEGEGRLTCTRCGHQETFTYDLLKHNYVNTLLFPSSCAYQGTQEQMCTECGHYRWLPLPLSTEHTWVPLWRGVYSCWFCHSYKDE